MFGSYMGTAAQSVGLKRNYSGFGRADRSIALLLGVLIAAMQSAMGWSDLEGPVISGEALRWNGISISITLALLGGVLTFITRFCSSLRDLARSDSATTGK